MIDREIHKAMALSLIPNVGPIKLNKWIKNIGSASAVYELIKSSLNTHSKSGSYRINLRDLNELNKKAAQEIEKCIKFERKILYRFSSDFPPHLKHCADSPVVLFFKGKKIPNENCWLSIVGSRKIDYQGKDLCHRIIDEWQGFDPVIVSGLAYGIDSLTHEYALSRGLYTIGVLGHGLDHMYPNKNKRLSEKMIENGGLMTEFWSTIRPERSHFIMRNRIIAGLSPVLVVVQAGKKSGALSSANFSFQYNRDVLAVPGKLGDPNHEGCHLLIASLKAQIYHTSPEYFKQQKITVVADRIVPFNVQFSNSLEEKVYGLIKNEKNLEIEALKMRVRPICLL